MFSEHVERCTKFINKKKVIYNEQYCDSSAHNKK